MKATHFPNNIILRRQCFWGAQDGSAPKVVRASAVDQRHPPQWVCCRGPTGIVRSEHCSGRRKEEAQHFTAIVGECGRQRSKCSCTTAAPPRPRQLGHCTSTAWLTSFDHLRMNASAGAHSTEREESIEIPLLNKESGQAAARGARTRASN